MGKTRSVWSLCLWSNIFVKPGKVRPKQFPAPTKGKLKKLFVASLQRRVHQKPCKNKESHNLQQFKMPDFEVFCPEIMLYKIHKIYLGQGHWPLALGFDMFWHVHLSQFELLHFQQEKGGTTEMTCGKYAFKPLKKLFRFAAKLFPIFFDNPCARTLLAWHCFVL